MISGSDQHPARRFTGNAQSGSPKIAKTRKSDLRISVLAETTLEEKSVEGLWYNEEEKTTQYA
jgi:hypothetical protein